MARADVDDVDWMADDVDFVLLPSRLRICWSQHVVEKKSHAVWSFGWLGVTSSKLDIHTYKTKTNTLEAIGGQLALTGETFANELSSRSMLSSSG